MSNTSTVLRNIKSPVECKNNVQNNSKTRVNKGFCHKESERENESGKGH